MRARAVVVLAAAAALALAGCSGEPEPDRPNAAEPTPGTSAAPSPDETPVEPTEVPEADGSEEPAEADGVSDLEPLPDGPVVTGTLVSNGHISVVVPDGYTEVTAYDGRLQFDGPPIPESADPENGAMMTSHVAVFPVGTSWAAGFYAAGDPGVTRTRYAVDVPGADSAVLEVLSLDAGFHQELVNSGGKTTWHGPESTATVFVRSGDTVSGISVGTHPGPAGLDLAASIARTITVVG